MPAVTSGKVLVTGANGFVGAWIARTLLEAGFSVRGTTRSEAKAESIRAFLSSFGERFEVVVVPDITKEDAFTPHAKDVVAIAHSASPVGVFFVNPADLIDPAVNGTLSVLQAAAASSSVKRVIIVSSTATIAPSGAPGTYDESSWNESCIDEVDRLGTGASGPAKYAASKTLAERKAWEWFEERKEALPWDLVSLVPVWVFGPPAHPVSGLDDLAPSMKVWYNNVVKGTMAPDALATTGGYYVDVRDISGAHIPALLRPEAGGQRFIIAAGPYMFQDFVSVAHRISNKVAAGNTEYDPSKAEQVVKYVTGKAPEMLGIKYRSMEEVTRDALEALEAAGML